MSSRWPLSVAVRLGARVWLFEPGWWSEKPPTLPSLTHPRCPSPNLHAPSVRRGGRETESHFTHLDTLILCRMSNVSMFFVPLDQPLVQRTVTCSSPRQTAAGPGSLRCHLSPSCRQRGAQSSPLGRDWCQDRWSPLWRVHPG